MLPEYRHSADGTRGAVSADRAISFQPNVRICCDVSGVAHASPLVGVRLSVDLDSSPRGLAGFTGTFRSSDRSSSSGRSSFSFHRACWADQTGYPNQKSKWFPLRPEKVTHVADRDERAGVGVSQYAALLLQRLAMSGLPTCALISGRRRNSATVRPPIGRRLRADSTVHKVE